MKALRQDHKLFDFLDQREVLIAKLEQESGLEGICGKAEGLF